MTTTNEPPLTPRLAFALECLVQQRAMQLDVLREFLGVTRCHTYATVAELRERGLIRPLVQVAGGPKWVVPTRLAAARHFGRPVRDWTPSPLWSRHGRAAAVARLALGAIDPQDWMSERELGVEQHRRGAYPYDGRMVRTSNSYALHAGAHEANPVWAVKVDTAWPVNPRQLVAFIEGAVAQASADGCNVVVWLCTRAHRPAAVRTAAVNIQSDLAFAAADFAEVTGRSPDVIPGSGFNGRPSR